MYVDRLLKVAEAIENDSVEGVGFNMNYFGRPHRNDNGVPIGFTERCIAGYTAALWPEEFENTPNINKIPKAAVVLGLVDEAEAFDWEKDSRTKFPLFYPPRTPETGDYSKITREHAGKVIRKLAETGEVDWSI